MLRLDDGFIADAKASKSRIVMIAFINLVHCPARRRATRSLVLGAAHNNRFKLRRQIVDSTMNDSIET
jgi:hypothetical protein